MYSVGGFFYVFEILCVGLYVAVVYFHCCIINPFYEYTAVCPFSFDGYLGGFSLGQ